MSELLEDYSADILKTLGQPTRMKIIEALRNGERCVSEIFTTIGEEQSNTSRHLSVMLREGILSFRKQKSLTFYSIKYPEDVLHIVDLARKVMALETAGRQKLIPAAMTRANIFPTAQQTGLF